jgi:hypothetical protein
MALSAYLVHCTVRKRRSELLWRQVAGEWLFRHSDAIDLNIADKASGREESSETMDRCLSYLAEVASYLPSVKWYTTYPYKTHLA